MPEGQVLWGILWGSESHSLPIASVNLFSVLSTSVPHWPSASLPTFMTVISLWLFNYSFLPHMSYQSNSFSGNIVRDWIPLLLSCSLSANGSFVVCCGWQITNRNGLPFITPLLWKEIFRMH
jgi:hypothetical protein